MMTALKAAYPTTDFTFGAASHMDYPHTYTDFFGYTATYGDAAPATTRTSSTPA